MEAQPQMYGRSKAKTFQIGEDYGEVMKWVSETIDTQELEISGHLENDVVTATTKKYRIAITEMIPKKESRWLNEIKG
jgi:hypothetical protein